MAAFDATHRLVLGYKPIQITYTYSVTINSLQSGVEDRNLDNAKMRRIFGISWTGDGDIADRQYLERIYDAYVRARGPYEGFYLDHRWFGKLIPVRFNSELSTTVRGTDACGEEWLIEIQDLQLVEVSDASLIDRS
jgi:hypothetical protein